MILRSVGLAFGKLSLISIISPLLVVQEDTTKSTKLQHQTQHNNPNNNYNFNNYYSDDNNNADNYYAAENYKERL
jgi:hypothetical protein